MDFDVWQRLTIAKAIIELTYSLGGCGFVQNKPHGGKRFKHIVMVFYEKDIQKLLSHHNRLLYMTAYVRKVELRRALIDPSSLLSIMSLSMLETLGIPRDRVF